VQACCGRSAIIYQLGESITTKLLESLVNSGFTELAHFTKAGILYVENINLIVSGSFGSNKLQVKCKNNNCKDFLVSFESQLTNL